MHAITLGWAPALTVLLLATTARADKPTADELEAAATAFADAANASGTDVAHRDLIAAAALVSPPLTYLGFSYDSGDGQPLSATAKACRKRWGSTGTVSAKQLPVFLECASFAQWQTQSDWSVEDVNQLPDLLVRFKSQLGKLAKTQTLVYAHLQLAAPPEYWTAFAGTKDADGHVKITAIVAGYVWHNN